MGSEMCIRDSVDTLRRQIHVPDEIPFEPLGRPLLAHVDPDLIACLLYTSDAADERSSVDLGGRRIIKKKTTTM